MNASPEPPVINTPNPPTPQMPAPSAGASDDAEAPAALVQHSPAALWAVLAVTALGMWGASIGWSAVYFVADHKFQFTQLQNVGLGVIGGFGYTMACLVSAKLTCWLKMLGLSARAILMLTVTVMGISAMTPGVIHQQWALWLFMATYVPLQGMLWPITEAFLSGGRRGRHLRNATGGFNISWSAAAVLSMWFVALTIDDHPMWSFVSLGIAHVLIVLVLLKFPKEPAPHLDEQGHAHSERADAQREKKLLSSFRALNFCSYVMMATMAPLLPGLMSGIGLEGGAKPLVNSVWMLTRVGMFVVLQWWHGWHGRWRTVIWAGLCVLTGCTMVMVAPAVWVMVVGFALFGIGAGAISCAAIYYAMEVGSAEVDAGGKHEAVTGAGYTIGPVLGEVISRMTGIGGR